MGAAPLPPGRRWAAAVMHGAWGGAGDAGLAVREGRGRHGELVAREAVHLAWRLERVPTSPAGQVSAIVTCCYYGWEVGLGYDAVGQCLPTHTVVARSVELLCFQL